MVLSEALSRADRVADTADGIGRALDAAVVEAAAMLEQIRAMGEGNGEATAAGKGAGPHISHGDPPAVDGFNGATYPHEISDVLETPGCSGDENGGDDDEQDEVQNDE